MNEAFNSVIKNTIHAYFQSSFCLCIFADGVLTGGHVGGIQIIVYSVENINNVEIHHRCDGIVIKSNDPRSKFEAIENRMKYQNRTRVQHNTRKYLIFVNNRKECLEVFHSVYTNFVIDLLNICYLEDSGGGTIFGEVKYELSFYTHKYVGVEGNIPVLLDKWFSENVSFLFGNTLMPDKFSDQEGRLLKVATFAYGPYSLPDIKYGTELSLITEFAKRHNNTLRIIENNVELWGETFPNFTGIGVFGHVINDEVDIGFCAIFYWLRHYWYIDYSQYYVRTGVTCIVPSPTVIIKWSDTFPEMTVLVQLVVFVMLLFCGLILYLAEKLHFMSYDKNNIHGVTPTTEINTFDTLNRIYLNIAQVILILPMTMIHKLRYKCIYIYLYLSSIIIYNIHIGYLSSKLTAPRYLDSINTVEELARRNIIWIGSQADAWIESIRYEETKSYPTIVQNFREVNEAVDETGTAAHAAERLMSGYFVIEDYIPLKVLQHLEIMQEDLYWQFTAFIARKNSVLLPALNDFILRALEAGLHLHWESQAIINYNLKEQEILLSQDNPRRYQMKISNFQGLFYVWLIGCTAATIVFILEISQSKWNRKKVINTYYE